MRINFRGGDIVSTVTDFLQAPLNGLLAPITNIWVRLLNNDTGINYYSNSTSDPNTGAFTFTAPPGDYSAYTGTAATVGGTPTLRSSHYKVSVTSGDDITAKSITALSSSPYVPSAAAGSAVFSGPTPWVDVTAARTPNGLAMGAKDDNGVTANQTAFANAISYLAGLGGGEIRVPFVTTGIYGITAGIDATAANNVRIWCSPGVKLKWFGGTGPTAMISTAPTAGNNTRAFNIYGLTLDCASASNVSGLLLNSWQLSWIQDLTILNVTGTAPTAALRLEVANSTGGAQSNTTGNEVRNYHCENVTVALQLDGAGPGTTDNSFFGMYLGAPYGIGGTGVSVCGIRFVKNCDSNTFYWTEIFLTGTNAIGVHFNDSTTPGSAVGVYNEMLYYIDVSVFGGATNCVGLQFDTCNQIAVDGFFHSPQIFTGTPILNNSNRAQSAWVRVGQDNSSNNTMDLLMLGVNLDTSGALPSRIDNSVQFVGALSGSNPGVQAGGSDPLIQLNLMGKGASLGNGWVNLGNNQHNYVQVQGAPTLNTPALAAIGDTDTSLGLLGTGIGVIYFNTHRNNFLSANGGSSGGGSAGFSTLGADANIDMTLSPQGKGRTVIKNGIAATGSAPTVGSGGAGTSALSILAGSTNMAGQFQVTTTGVVAGAVLGVVTFNGGPLVAAPRAVVASLSAPTAGVAAPLVVGTDTYSTTTFTIRALNAPTNGTYIITWIAIF